MPATRMLSQPAEVGPEQRRDEVISILAAGLVRLIQGSQRPGDTPTDASASMPADTLADKPAEKLSESGEIGLELPRETRLSGVAG